MSIGIEQNQTVESSANSSSLFGSDFFQDFTKLTERYVEYSIIKQKTLADNAAKQRGISSDENPTISKRGIKYINSIFGEGTVESLGLTHDSIDLVIDAIMWINRNIRDKDKKMFYINTLRLMFQGYRTEEIAKRLGFTQNQINNGLIELKRRMLHRTCGKKMGQNALRDTMIAREEASLNEPLGPQNPESIYNFQFSDDYAAKYSGDFDYSIEDSSYDDVFDMLNEEGLCQQIDPGISTGEYVLSSYDASRVCGMCHLSKMCLEYAIKSNQNKGIWGGRSIRNLRRKIQGQKQIEKAV